MLLPDERTPELQVYALYMWHGRSEPQLCPSAWLQLACTCTCTVAQPQDKRCSSEEVSVIASAQTSSYHELEIEENC